MQTNTVIARAILLGTASLSIIAFASGTAQAQQTPKADEAEAEEVAQIIVTGTRVKRDGYAAPTPLTVMDAATIAKAAPANIADYVNQLPQLSPSATSRQGNGATSTGTAGLNLLDLRGLGPNRTLVLVDGQRVAPSTQTGAVDINNLPTGLLQRVELVTGGASAAYGSDAIAGVVNFIIDRKFKGIKLNVMGGMTSRSDNKNYQFTGSFGTSFADDRANFVASFEHQHEDGIDFIDVNKRQWARAIHLIQPSGSATRIISDNVAYNNVSQGAVINGVVLNSGAAQNFITNTTVAGVVTSRLTNTTNPFFGVQFGQGGAAQPFVYGALAGNFMIGGNQWNETTVVAMTPRIDRTNGWASLNYEFSPAISARIEGSYGRTHTKAHAAYQRNVNNIIVSAQNPYLPANLRAAATTAGIASVRVGYASYDLGRMENDITRENFRLVGTLFGEFAPGWNWEAYYQYGRTNLDVKLRNSTDNIKFSNAIDAVTNATGQIVCRSTLANPTDGCVPLNIFGIGVASPQAIAYVKGIASQTQSITQQVAAFSVNGNPFETWAGPVSIATGFEYRKESVTAVGDPVSAGFTVGPATYPSPLGGFFTGNFKSNTGSYNVKEVFGEVVVPLAKGHPLANSLEVNAAVRYTNYSTAGSVTTWKAGVTWEWVDDLRFRFVRSRDVRAPNLQELFVAGSSQAADVTDPQLPAGTTNPVRIFAITDGNTALVPEKADTLGMGVVFKPSFLPGFSASLDYYNIKIRDAIQSLNVNEIASLCAAGQQSYCALITRATVGGVANVITAIRRSPVNIGLLNVRGLDFDASFRQPVGPFLGNDSGAVVFRLLVTKAINWNINVNGAFNEAVGENGGPNAAPSIPRYRTFTTLGYEGDKTTLTLTMRTVSAGVYDVTWRDGVEIEKNYIQGAKYFDLSGSQRLWGDKTKNVEAYFKIENLMDKDPPLAAGSTSSAPPYNPTLYDGLGRAFRVGVRAKF
jgi:iron complex outermembrane recepter protein